MAKLNTLPDALSSLLHNDRDWIPEHIVESAWLEHTPFAAWLMAALEPRVFVELGTHRAVSYMAFCQANLRRANPGKCFAIDTWKGDEHAGLYNEDVFAEVERLNQKYCAFSTLTRGTFDEALPLFADGSIDLLHIDGFHSYEAVSHDFHSWLPKMSDKGVVLFHDTEVRDKAFGVWRLWAELISEYPHFDFHHGHGLGVLAVGPVIAPKIAPLLHPEVAAKDVERFRHHFGELGGEVSRLYRKKFNITPGKPKKNFRSRLLGHIRSLAQRFRAK
ncbi:MAG: class I SAM-dependent methyltransferase [Roseomonas sp.]|nr:class I SAM-dependent methyltransferase [Roseomonas sp.]MCA3428998.1 class I SAM-dependent methyltransferase [Roseomonas sp.]MCA3432081.1 class I SAM-dependent methyltransferase [Roseomonas sp.]